MKKIVSTFIKYGISELLAQRLVGLNLTASTVRATSKKNLITKYGLTDPEAQEIKSCILRSPIDSNVLKKILLNNNFTCCCCKGIKGQSFLIHHIEEYEVSQNNSYSNLAVVCPTCHDLAHSKRALTLTISKDQIREAKKTWEQECINQRSFWQKQLKRKIWGCTFSEGSNLDMRYSFQLAMQVDGEIANCTFDLIFLDRGNMIISGDFCHFANEKIVSTEIYYWEMHLGKRSSEKNKAWVKLQYMDDSRVIWAVDRDLFEVVPKVLELNFINT